MSLELSWLLSLLSGPLVVDRIDGDFAVVEAPDGALLDLPLAWFPPDLGEGDRFLPPTSPIPLADAPAPAPAPPGALPQPCRPAALTTVNP